MDHSVDLSTPDFLKIKNQQMPVPYGSMLHISPTNLLLLAAKQEPGLNTNSFCLTVTHFT